jgi:hypothetical protein
VCGVRIPRRWSGSLRPSIDSATNDTLNEFLCDLLHVPIGALRISSGERSRRKHVSTDASKATRCGGALKLIEYVLKSAEPASKS